MGGCGTKPIKRAVVSMKMSIAPYKNLSNYTIKIIQPSLFYNLVVKDLNREITNQQKDNEYIDFRELSKFKNNHLKAAMNIDTENFKEGNENLYKSLKILLDFKNLIIVGDNLVSFDNYIAESLFEFFKLLENAKISLNRIYILNGSITEILNRFPFLGVQREVQLEGKHLPLLVYSEIDKMVLQMADVTRPQEKISNKKSEGIKKEGSLQENIVYVQDYSRFLQNFDEKVCFEALGIKNIFIAFNAPDLDKLKPKQDLSTEKTLDNSFVSKDKKYTVFVQEIADEKATKGIFSTIFKQKSPILLVHDKNQIQPTILSLISYLETNERISSSELRNYIEERIPKLTVSQNVVSLEDISIKKKNSPKKTEKAIDADIPKNSIKSRSDEIRDAFLELKKAYKNNMESVADVYNLISKILDNIIKTPDDEKYKSLNENNAKLKETLFKHDASKKLLEIAGFHRKEGETSNLYYNLLDANSLKHIKVDIDIGYKNIQNSQN